MSCQGTLQLGFWKLYVDGRGVYHLLAFVPSMTQDAAA